MHAPIVSHALDPVLIDLLLDIAWHQRSEDIQDSPRESFRSESESNLGAMLISA
jgi:hypothetical protein